MARLAEENKIDKSFKEVLEDLEHEESVEMISEVICYSIHSPFVYFY